MNTLQISSRQFWTQATWKQATWKVDRIRYLFASALLMGLFCTNLLLCESLRSIVDDVVLPSMKRQAIPGMAVSICVGDKAEVFCYGFATKDKPVTANTIFALASITKVFTATDLALHVQEGKITLQEHVTNFLPTLKRQNGAINEVTFEQLATHTASLPREASVHSDQNEVIAFLQHWQPEFPIGTRYRYSNLGFAVIGYALETIEHERFEKIIENEIARPLHMNSTVIDVPGHLLGNVAQGYSPQGLSVTLAHKGAFLASGALKSTGADMLKFLQANLQIGSPSQLLKAIELTQKGYFRVNDKLTLGLGWQIVHLQGHLVLDKNGGLPGFSSYIGMLPQTQIGCVILANKAKIHSTRLGRKLLRHLTLKLQNL